MPPPRSLANLPCPTLGVDAGPDRYDVIVIGAGSAGSTAARYAAERGLHVHLIDLKAGDRHFGIDVPARSGNRCSKNSASGTRDGKRAGSCTIAP